MKKYLFIIFILSKLDSFATTTYSVGASRDYTTITAAYAACTGSTDYIIEIYNDYSYAGETGGTANITLGSLPSKNSSNTVTIRPASGQSLSFSGTATSIFELLSVSWLIIDGRAGGVGTSAWTLINSSSAISKRVFILSDVTNTVIKYCFIKGDNASTSAVTGGIFYFANTLGTTGNDNNTIDNCTFQQNSSNPYTLLIARGSASRINSNNLITNCDFINFKACGILLEIYSESFTISSNNFYQTANQTPTNNIKMLSIRCNDGHIITNNYFGGQASSCGGSPYTLLNSIYSFYAISFENSIAGSTNTITNNTIANISISNTGTGGVNALICGIITAGSGHFDIGTPGNGNVIGAISGTSSITIVYNGTLFNEPSFSGIELYSQGNHSLKDNTIGAIDYTTSLTDGYDQISLIRLITAGTVIIDNNNLGNTTANNITINSNSGFICGISTSTFEPIVTITNNIFQNYTVDDISGGVNAKIYGFYGIVLAPSVIASNVVKTFMNNTNNPLPSSSFTDAAIVGLSIITSGTDEVSIYGNRIIELSSSYSGATQINIYGLVAYTSVGSVFVYRNKIKTLSISSSNSSSILSGIYIESPSATPVSVYNNIITLSDESNTVAKNIRGIEVSATALGSVTEIYFNTVKIFTNYSSGSGISSAFYLFLNSGDYIVKNNIFQNVSTGSGDHYSQNWTSAYGTTANIRNNYNEAPNASKLINYGGTDETLAAWRTAIGDGSNTEITGSITVSSTTGIASSGSVTENAGTPIAGITTDYDLNSRDATNPWMGAFETITPLPIELLSISAKCQKSKSSNSEYGATIQWTTATEINSDYFIVEGSKDGFVWEVKDTIDGAGINFQPTNYYYHDDFINPTPENETVVYYRVSQTDFDGVVKMYEVLSCKCEASDKIKIHPVPATEYIVINFGDQNNVPNSFQITDMFGRLIEDIVISGGKEGNTSYKLNIENYASGRYIIKINDWKMKEDAVFIKE